MLPLLTHSISQTVHFLLNLATGPSLNELDGLILKNALY